MKKINIIRKTEDFDKIIKHRHYYSNRFFVVYIIEKQEQYNRFGISIPKKVGISVTRNKLKRQIKSIIDDNKEINPNYDYVIIARKEILNLEYNDKLKILNLLLSKIDGAWKSENK